MLDYTYINNKLSTNTKIHLIVLRFLYLMVVSQTHSLYPKRMRAPIIESADLQNPHLSDPAPEKDK
jgi:hypothetical protein